MHCLLTYTHTHTHTHTHSINDNESCAELLLERMDMDGVNTVDSGGRYTYALVILLASTRSSLSLLT